ncbi:MAG: UDP-N-acetylmuramate dehydrogenase [Gammaproteobacteria bacterium]|nr:UDP-N-acetylmuramate dehydrogenase [Gammaproteobacteria bacterium]
MATSGGKLDVLRNEPMAKHTSWRVGGPAEMFFRPASIDELKAFLDSLPAETPITWLGLGSNLLVRDGGIKGAVIATGGLPKEAERFDGDRVRASAALPCATLAKRCAAWGIGPAAFFAGIPGSIGGALAMNAGAFGGETWDAVASVETIDRTGTLRSRERAEFSIGYRSVTASTRHEWFIAAIFAFSSVQATDSAEIRALLRERSDKQPLGVPSAGSVFRNPGGAHAGALIEQAGLKGMQCGGAVVADKHANFIINTGNATAADIERLIGDVQKRVHAATGIWLETEVRIVGEAAAEPTEVVP